LRHDPYDVAFVDHALPEPLKADLSADAPHIPDRGIYGLPDPDMGRHFAAVIQDLLSVRFGRLVEHKFHRDLSHRPRCIVMMGRHQ
jgi:hypothetical protein